MSDNLELRLNNVESMTQALVDMISNKPELGIDSYKIRDFIDKYSTIQSLLKDDTLTTAITKINELNSMIEDIKKQTEVPLAVAKDQSQKIMDIYTSDEVELALNISDVKRFKSEIFIAFRDFVQYIKDLDIDTKMNLLNSQIANTKELFQDFIAMKHKFNDLTNKLEQEQTLIDKIEKVNQEQDEQIRYVNNITVLLEKEIESYAFFTNEFNKIYLNAKEFIVRFAEALERIERIEERDEALWNLTQKMLNAFTDDYASLEVVTFSLSQTIESYTKEMLSWLNHSMLFVNEVKAYNLSLNAYNNKFDEIQNRCKNINSKIDEISL